MTVGTAETREWPEMGEELARKATETLHASIHANGEGSLSDRELWIVTGTILDLIQGLAPAETTNVVNQVRMHLDKTFGAKAKKGRKA